MKSVIAAFSLIAAVLATSAAVAQSTEENGPTVHHIVLVSLKKDVPEQQIDEMIEVGEALLNDIPGVLEVSLGRKAREDRDVHVKDYDVALHVTWENDAVGDVYATHPLHLSFLKLYKPLFAGIKVADFYGN